jgi:hypothetical protein
VLEDKADAALARASIGRVFAVEEYLAALRELETRDDAQKCGLAGTRGAEQRDELAGRHLQGDAVERLEVAEGLCDVPGFDAHASLSPPPVCLITASRAARH